MALEPSPIELVPLGRMTASLREPFVLSGAPGGTRIVAEIDTGRFEGERLQADIVGQANADWVVLGPGGVGQIDVRSLLRTDDGADIYVHYTGRLRLAEQTVYSTPLFETGDERYTWLNDIQAVGKGATDGQNLVYEVFEVR